jgi:hypothetical protein
LEITGDLTTSVKLFNGSSGCPVFFDIKTVVLTTRKEDQFSGKEAKDCNAHLTHFLEAYNTIDPAGVSESDKRFCLFVSSLSGRVNDCLNALSKWHHSCLRPIEEGIP